MRGARSSRPERRSRSPKPQGLTRASFSRPFSPWDGLTPMRSNRKRTRRGLGIRDWGFAQAMLNVAVLCVSVMYVAPGFSPAATAQQYTFEEVAAGLQHQDAGPRPRTIQILKDADYAEATVPIGTALTDVDDRVQLAAIDAERSLFTTRV